jgi:hypothetical protein
MVPTSLKGSSTKAPAQVNDRTNSSHWSSGSGQSELPLLRVATLLNLRNRRVFDRFRSRDQLEPAGGAAPVGAGFHREPLAHAPGHQVVQSGFRILHMPTVGAPPAGPSRRWRTCRTASGRRLGIVLRAVELAQTHKHLPSTHPGPSETGERESSAGDPQEDTDGADHCRKADGLLP